MVLPREFGRLYFVRCGAKNEIWPPSSWIKSGSRLVPRDFTGRRWDAGSVQPGPAPAGCSRSPLARTPRYRWMRIRVTAHGSTRRGELPAADTACGRPARRSASRVSDHRRSEIHTPVPGPAHAQRRGLCGPDSPLPQAGDRRRRLSCSHSRSDLRRPAPVDGRRAGPGAGHSILFARSVARRSPRRPALTGPCLVDVCGRRPVTPRVVGGYHRPASAVFVARQGRVGSPSPPPAARPAPYGGVVAYLREHAARAVWPRSPSSDAGPVIPRPPRSRAGDVTVVFVDVPGCDKHRSWPGPRTVIFFSRRRRSGPRRAGRRSLAADFPLSGTLRAGARCLPSIWSPVRPGAALF